MNPLKIIRKLGKALRGGATFRQIVIGVFLGFAIGMMPGVSLTLILLVALLLLLNTNTGVAMVGFVIGKALCLTLARITFEIGFLLIHSLGLAGVVRSMGDTPFLALMDFHVYCLLGALPFILIIGGALAYGIARLITGFQRLTREAGEKNERYKKFMANPAVRAVLWLAFGGKKETSEDEPPKEALFCKGRLIAGVLVTGLLCLLSYVYIDALAHRALEEGFGGLTGAEVNIASASLSPLTGRLVAEGVEFTDPARPTHNQIQAETVLADIDVGALFARRLVADLVSSKNVQSNTERDSPGEVYIPTLPAPPFEPLPPDMSVLEQIRVYKDKITETKRKVDKVMDFLNDEDPALSATDKASIKDRLLEEARLKGYLGLSAKDVLSKYPTWHVRRLEINKLNVEPKLPTIRIVGEDLSSSPTVLGRKPSIKPLPDEDALAELNKRIGGPGGLIKDKLKGIFGR